MSVKCCPLCQLVSEPSAWQCQCGYEFGQPVEKVLVLLRSQRRNGRILLALMLAVMTGAVAMLYFAVISGGLYSLGLIAALVVGMLRTVRTLSITSDSLRQLEDRARQLEAPAPAELPKATLLPP